MCLGSTIAPHALARLKADAASLPDTSVQSAEASLPSAILTFTSSSMGTVGTALGVITMMPQFHVEMQARVLDNGETSELFPISSSVTQGALWLQLSSVSCSPP